MQRLAAEEQRRRSCRVVGAVELLDRLRALDRLQVIVRVRASDRVRETEPRVVGTMPRTVPAASKTGIS
ncbi:unnamed protein product, partial [marine sediment metagenome]